MRMYEMHLRIQRSFNIAIAVEIPHVLYQKRKRYPELICQEYRTMFFNLIAQIPNIR